MSGSDIDSVEIGGLGKLKLTNLKDNLELSGFIDWSKSKSNTDGSYQIKIYANKFRQHQFGYYTNGLPLNSGFNILIQKDTINVQEILD